MQKCLSPGDNRDVETANHAKLLTPKGLNPFREGIIVIVALGNPQETFCVTEEPK